MEQPVRVDEMAELCELSRSKLKELVRSCPKAGRIRIGSSRPYILGSEEKKAEVFGKPTDHKSDGIHMQGVKGKTFLTEIFIEAVGRAGLKDRDTRMEGRRGSSPRMEPQEVGWSRVEGGARPAPQLDGQRSSWADVASNRYYSLSN